MSWAAVAAAGAAVVGAIVENNKGDGGGSSGGGSSGLGGILKGLMPGGGGSPTNLSVQQSNTQQSGVTSNTVITVSSPDSGIAPSLPATATIYPASTSQSTQQPTTTYDNLRNPYTPTGSLPTAGNAGVMPLGTSLGLGGDSTMLLLLAGLAAVIFFTQKGG